MVQWTRAAYAGSYRKLVLAFDIGTTFSGISYSILDPGTAPKIQPVTRYNLYDDGHQRTTSISKVPTVIYYDELGNARALGAETTEESVVSKGWMKVEWFKLYLRPTSAPGADVTPNLPPLPPNKTIVEVYVDFLRYMQRCARDYITHAHGLELWSSVENGRIDYVLSHPNGWEGKQQSIMRMAAIKAGLITDSTEDRDRVIFISEGEASLHFAAHDGVLDSAVKKGGSIAVVDAGGGTIDVSCYRKKKKISDERGTFEEVTPSQSYFHGSVFVTLNARVFLESHLKDSVYLDDLDKVLHSFDTTTKLRFRDANQPQFVKFGSATDTDIPHNIRFGQLKLDGNHIAMFFKPSVECITHAIMEQRKIALKPISHVVLVGGFSASDWLFERVRESLEPLRLKVLRAGSQPNKAVADGAVSFYLDHFVRNRVSKVAYGVFCRVTYSPKIKGHKEWRDSHGEDAVNINNRGAEALRDYFSVLVPKGALVSEGKEFRISNYYVATTEMDVNKDKLSVSEGVMHCYRGEKKVMSRQHEPESFTAVCKIRAKLENVPELFGVAPQGWKYREKKCDLVLFLGNAEMRAELAWKENGIEKRCVSWPIVTMRVDHNCAIREPAKLLYDYGDIPTEISL
ncbi:hypothetical protein GALMADRAFT_1071822 [Galerina marginata CBS 339.88]|uniref:Uncharacterized protein n=1 Tax=Galerina marginata (strain CBS 339.88) TaxID=685588 RepID=A0A067S9U2_GALM3|nr:hypothetical protein GALMADRAFT_1071822 [Galerina marginata CBS 339.88]